MARQTVVLYIYIYIYSNHLLRPPLRMTIGYMLLFSKLLHNTNQIDTTSFNGKLKMHIPSGSLFVRPRMQLGPAHAQGISYAMFTRIAATRRITNIAVQMAPGSPPSTVVGRSLSSLS